MNRYDPYDVNVENAEETSLMGDDRTNLSTLLDSEKNDVDADISQYGHHALDVKIPTFHFQTPTDDSQVPPYGPDGMLSSTTQHFGPAPKGRVDRRTHNAANPRRIKQSAVLDENGYFVVEMPIPTRLAQFLPVKGVDEQKSTR